MSMELSAQREVLHHLTRTDPDPRVRRRAHALLLLSRGQSVVAVARLFETAPHRVRAWRSRFLARGRQGLADEPRSGRPPKLDAAALAFLEEALEASPQTYGCPVKIPAAGEDRKFAVFGALDYASGQLVWQVSPHKDGKAFVAFLDHLVATFPNGPLVV